MTHTDAVRILEDIVREEYGYDATELKGKSRKQHMVFMRNALFGILFHYCDMDAHEIARLTRYRDRTTIIHSIEVLDYDMDNDDFRGMYLDLESKFIRQWQKTTSSSIG